VHEMLNKL